MIFTWTFLTKISVYYICELDFFQSFGGSKGPAYYVPSYAKILWYTTIYIFGAIFYRTKLFHSNIQHHSADYCFPHPWSTITLLCFCCILLPLPVLTAKAIYQSDNPVNNLDCAVGLSNWCVVSKTVKIKYYTNWEWWLMVIS